MDSVKKDAPRKDIRDYLSYNKDTGKFIWIKTNSNRVKVGTECLTKNMYGYIVIGFDKKLFLAHRLAFLFVEGKFPDYVVDHINGDREDNSWDNLRACSRKENSRNMRVIKRGSSIYKGVCFYKKTSKRSSQIMVDSKRIHLGLFPTEKEAALTYNDAARKFFGEFAKLNEVENG